MNEQNEIEGLKERIRLFSQIMGYPHQQFYSTVMKDESLQKCLMEHDITFYTGWLASMGIISGPEQRSERMKLKTLVFGKAKTQDISEPMNKVN